MSEVVDRVAEAIVAKINEIDGEGIPWEKGSDEEKDEARVIARAAIEAMLEPTGEMTGAGWEHTADPCWEVHVKDAWRAMINEALK